MMWYLSGFIHFDQYRKEILFKKLRMSSFIFVSVKRSLAETNCENLCKSKGYQRN